MKRHSGLGLVVGPRATIVNGSRSAQAGPDDSETTTVVVRGADRTHSQNVPESNAPPYPVVAAYGGSQYTMESPGGGERSYGPASNLAPRIDLALRTTEADACAA